jgi:hypothetical protein
MRTPPARRCRQTQRACLLRGGADAGGTSAHANSAPADAAMDTHGSRFACVRDLAQHGALPRIPRKAFSVKRQMITQKGQNISHLFGRGTTVLIGPVWYLGLFWGRSGPMVFRKVPEDTTKTSICLNFSHCGRILRWRRQFHPNCNTSSKSVEVQKQE